MLTHLIYHPNRHALSQERVWLCQQPHLGAVHSLSERDTVYLLAQGGRIQAAVALGMLLLICLEYGRFVSCGVISGVSAC